MPTLFIHAVNAAFQSRDDGADYDHPENALEIGIRAAVTMASDEVLAGERSAAVEVRVEREDGTPVLRSVVAVSVSPLLSSVTVPPFNAA